MEVLLAHLAGDYLIQSHWMASEKTKRWWPAIVHGITYTIPYAFITQSVLALAVIAVSHIIIDRYRLARHVNWLRNQIAPKGFRAPHNATGSPAVVPDWLAVSLLFISDNTIHLVINYTAVGWL